MPFQQEDEGFADTEVMILSAFQAWLTQAEWNMFSNAQTLATVLRTWISMRALESPEAMFHPRIYNKEEDGNAQACITIRVQLDHVEAYLGHSGTNGVVAKVIRDAPKPEIIWLPDWPPAAANMLRLTALRGRTTSARGVVLGRRGPGIRVPATEMRAKAHEILQ
jgi:hypothetical protein